MIFRIWDVGKRIVAKMGLGLAERGSSRFQVLLKLIHRVFQRRVFRSRCWDMLVDRKNGKEDAHREFNFLEQRVR